MIVETDYSNIYAMDVIYETIRKNLPRFKREVIKKLSFDIKMVALGVKSSLLIDTIAINDNLNSFEALIEELNAKSPFPSINTFKLRLLCIKDDFFIVNLPEILQTIRRKRLYINVNSNLPHPTLLSDYSVRMYHGQFKVVT